MIKRSIFLNTALRQSLRRPSSWAPADGYLEDVLAVFQIHSHPIILLNHNALGWMGSKDWPEAKLDLLVRQHQIDKIATDVLEIRDWALLQAYNGCSQAVLRYKLKDHNGFTLTLICEAFYCLLVDGPVIQVPDTHCYNTVLIQDEFHPDPSLRRYGPRRLADDDVAVLPPTLACIPDSDIKLYIPTIPRMIKALIRQAERKGTLSEDIVAIVMTQTRNVNDIKVGKAMSLLKDLIEDLYLEVSHTLNELLAQLSPVVRDILLVELIAYDRNMPVVPTQNDPFRNYRPWHSREQNMRYHTDTYSYEYGRHAPKNL